MSNSVVHMPFTKRFTGNFGFAYPVVCKRLPPRTLWRQDLMSLVRSQPMLAPAMGRISVTFMSYFVPNRLVNSTFEDFITGGLDGLQDPAAPVITVNTGTGFDPGSLADFLNMPTGVDDITVSADPFRAYALIYNNYLRDEQLMPAISISTAAGLDTTTSQALMRAAWRRDYFTKARPSPQLGAAVAVPLVGSAPVVTTGVAPTFSSATSQPAGNFNLRVQSASSNILGDGATGSGSVDDLRFGSTTGLESDLTAVAGPTVEEIRELSAIQRFKERMNNYGARYVEYLQSMFGISPQDARLQLPEYIGGGEFTVQISEILQTGPTGEDTTPLGTLAGHGIGKGNARRIKYFTKEHGIIMTLMVIRPDTEYSQGIPREWMYDNKYDFPQPDFAQLGDQEVYKGEIFAQGTSADRDVWGYNPRYSELFYIPSTSHGEFRKDQPLNYWTLTRQFDAPPALNAAFVECDGTNRIFAVKDEDQFQVTCRVNIKAKFPIPQNATPRIK